MQKELLAFGNGLKILRKTRKLNQAEFAALFNLTPSSISRIEGATAVPNFDTALKLSAFFDLTPEGVMAIGGREQSESNPPVSPEVAGYLEKARAVLESKDGSTLKAVIDQFLKE